MAVWRVIVTDTESLTGVAPVCPAAASGSHRIPDTGAQDDTGVYDCCPRPHIECWSERAADAVSKALTETEAELCS
jgi:hypothetical protein